MNKLSLSLSMCTWKHSVSNPFCHSLNTGIPWICSNKKNILASGTLTTLTFNLKIQSWTHLLVNIQRSPPKHSCLFHLLWELGRRLCGNIQIKGSITHPHRGLIAIPTHRRMVCINYDSNLLFNLFHKIRAYSLSYQRRSLSLCLLKQPPKQLIVILNGIVSWGWK